MTLQRNQKREEVTGYFERAVSQLITEYTLLKDEARLKNTIESFNVTQTQRIDAQTSLTLPNRHSIEERRNAKRLKKQNGSRSESDSEVSPNFD